jgi:membrane protease YdiL (CAAX protease family)
MQFYGFLPRFFMGVLLGYLLVYTGSLWVPVCAHMVNNGTAVLMAYFYPETIKEETTAVPNAWLVGGSIIVLGLLLSYLYKLSKNKVLT